MKLIFLLNQKERTIRLPLSVLPFLSSFFSSEKGVNIKGITRKVLRELKKHKKLYGSFLLLEIKEKNLTVFKIII